MIAMRPNLSPREQEIVVMVGRDGASYKAIARSLGISVSTIRTHVGRICTKFRASRLPREALVRIYWSSVHTNADTLGADGDTAD